MFPCITQVQKGNNNNNNNNFKKFITNRTRVTHKPITNSTIKIQEYSQRVL